MIIKDYKDSILFALFRLIKTYVSLIRIIFSYHFFELLAAQSVEHSVEDGYGPGANPGK